MKARILFVLCILLSGYFAGSAGKLISYFYAKPLFYIGISAIIPLLLLFLLLQFRQSVFFRKKFPVALSVILVTLSPLFLLFLYSFRPYSMYFSLAGETGIVLLIPAAFILGNFSSFQRDQRNIFPVKLPVLTWIVSLIFCIGFISAILSDLAVGPAVMITVSSLAVVLIIIQIVAGPERSSQKIFPATFCFLFLAVAGYGYYRVPPLKIFPEQKSYEDKIVFRTRTALHDLTVIQWKKYYWLFIDGLKNISSADDYLFYEPFIHPVVKLANRPARILILGGENGCAARELLKYDFVRNIDVVPFDTSFADLSRSNPILSEMNGHSLSDPRVNIMHENIDAYILAPDSLYDLLIEDLPDPVNLEYNQYYTLEFYRLCSEMLRDNGILVTQAGSPFYAPEAFVTLRNTIGKAGFSAVPLHNQVMTLGEWGWIIGAKKGSGNEIFQKLDSMSFRGLNTEWINGEAMKMLTRFGKSPDFSDTVPVNTMSEPVLFEFYRGSVRQQEGP